MESLKDIWAIYQQGDQERARRTLVARLSRHPNDARAWVLLASMLDDAEQRADCCRRALALDPGNPYATRMLQSQTAAATVDRARHTRLTLNPFDEPGIEETSPVQHEPAPWETELADRVVRELGLHASEDQVTRMVCEQAGLSWPAASKFVREVITHRRADIVKRTSPVLLIISGATLLGGTIWFVIEIVAVVSVLTALANAKSGAPLPVDVVIYAPQYLLISLAMILGGSIGIYRVLKDMGKVQVSPK